jgi:hypothetical protein
MQEVSQHNVKISAISWQPKPQSHASISDVLACNLSSKVVNFLLIAFGVWRVAYKLFLISANVRGGGTI